MSEIHESCRPTGGGRVVTVRVRELGGSVPSGAALRLSVLIDGPADADSTTVGQVVVDDWDGRLVDVDVDVDVACRSEVSDLIAFGHLGAEHDINEGDWLTTVAYPVHHGRVEITLDRLS